MRCVLLSVLIRQQLSLKDEFRRRYPHCWLVWEEGAWNVTPPGEQSLSRTMPPLDELQDCLPTGDVLAFELDVSKAPALTLGRSTQNDIVIDDNTVSREHLVLTCAAPDQWSVESKGSSQRLSVAGKNVVPGAPVPLRPRDVLKVGGVVLTFYDPAGFDRRLQSEAKKLIARPRK